MANPLCGHVGRRTGCSTYTFSVTASTRWWYAMVIGAFYGFAFALVVYLAKGGPKSGDAPYVIPSGVIRGAITGLLVVMWAIKTI